MINVLKKIVGILFMLSIIKMICFPAPAPKTDDELVSEAAKNWKLSEEDVSSIRRLQTADEQRDAYKKLYLVKVNEQKKKLKKGEDAKAQRAKDYFKQKVEGRASQREAFWALKDDFQAFADKKGGVIRRLADVVKRYTDRVEAVMKREEEARKAKEEEEEKLNEAARRDEEKQETGNDEDTVDEDLTELHLEFSKY